MGIRGEWVFRWSDYLVAPRVAACRPESCDWWPQATFRKPPSVHHRYSTPSTQLALLPPSDTHLLPVFQHSSEFFV
jgi:hypothetical protein